MAPPLMLLVLPRFEPGKQPRQDLALEVLLGYLRACGLSAQAVDAQLSRLEPEAIAAFVQETQAKIVYWHLRRRTDFQSAASMIPLSKRRSPRALMIAGGDFAAGHDAAMLERVRDLDGVIRGEPELPLEALGQRVARGEEWRYEAGLSARAGGVIRNAPRRLIEDLDLLSPAADDLFDAGRLVNGQQVLFSRGCNSDCSYCGLQTPNQVEHPHRTRFWRGRSSRAIVDEIEHYHAARKVTHFIFNSFVLFGYEPLSTQLEEVAREILRRRLAVTFSFVTHPGHLCRNRSLLPLLKEAGLRRLTLGIDTGLTRALQMYQLEFSCVDTLNALRLLHEQAIDFLPSFIFYDPLLTVEEIRDNLDFIEEMQPFFRHLETPFGSILARYFLNTALQVRAETPLYAHLLRHGLAEETDLFDSDPVVRFQHPEVGKIHRAHGLVLKTIGRGIRPILDSPRATGRFPHINLLPIELMRVLVSAVETDPAQDEASVASTVSEWICHRLRPHIREIFEAL